MSGDSDEKAAIACWFLGHNNSDLYSDGDYANGLSPTFHCKRCGEVENGDERNILMRVWHWIVWQLHDLQVEANGGKGE